MKTFKVTETIPATLVKVYEVKAKNAEEAMENYLNGKGVEVDFQVSPDESEAEFDVEKM